MEPYKYKTNSSTNKSTRSWEGSQDRTAHVAYPTTHLQRPNDNDYGNSSTFLRFPNNFKKSADTGFWQQMRGGEQETQIFSSTGTQKFSRQTQPGPQDISRRNFQRSPTIDSRRDRAREDNPNIFDINKFGYSRRSPIPTEEIDFRATGYESPETSSQQQEYLVYDSQSYSRRSPNIKFVNPEIQTSYGRLPPSRYEPRRDVQKSHLNESPIPNYNREYKNNSPLRYQASTSHEEEENYLQMYSGEEDFGNESLSNAPFLDETSYHNSPMLSETRVSSVGKPRTLVKTNRYVDSEERSDINVNTYQSPMSSNKTGLLKNVLPYTSPLFPPLSMKPNFPSSSSRKRKQQDDEDDTNAKLSRIQRPITNNVPPRPSSRLKSDKQGYKSPILEQRAPLSMAEEYVNKNFNSKPNYKPNPVRRKLDARENIDKIPKNKPLSMAEQYINRIKEDKLSFKPRPGPRIPALEVLVVSKHFPFHKFTVEEIEELKTELLEKSENLQSLVSCRKKARLLHFKCRSEKDVKWIKNACEKCSPWRGIALKTIKINYTPPRPVVIYTDKTPNHAMNPEQLKKLCDLFAKKMMESPNEKCIEVVELVRRRGKLIVYCNNVETLHWLMETKQELKKWEECSLVVSIHDLPPYYLCEMLLPKGHKDVNKALARLDRQNDDFDTQTWFVVSKYESSAGIKLVVSVEPEVLNAFEKVENKPFLDFTRIEITMIRKMKDIKEQFSVPK